MMLMSSILLNEAFVPNWDQGSGKTTHAYSAGQSIFSSRPRCPLCTETIVY